MNIKQVLTRNLEKLTDSKIDNYRYEAEAILAFAIKKPREFLFSHPEYKLSLLERIKNKILIVRRIKKTPLAYLTGNREFFGLDFIVNKNVLIPRQETELMIDEALKISNKKNACSYIDIGTGSGCIIITLAKRISKSNFWGLDISTKALKVARKNAKRHKVLSKIKFIKSNLLKEIMNNKIDAPIVFLANLPYLTAKQVSDSPTIQKEPKLALISANNGLEHYHLLFKQIKASRLAKPIFILCEIDDSQKKKMSLLIEREFSGLSYEIKKDLKGLPRLAIIKIPAQKKESEVSVKTRK